MEKIYEILANLRPEFDFRNSSNFIEDGLLDSFDVISIVTDIEEKFGVLIDALDILPENFVNVNTIANVIRKNGGSLKII